MRRALTYLQARFMLLLLGLGLAVGQSLLAWERGAAPLEVLAPVLYIPVFAGAVFWGIAGGMAGAGLSGFVYVVLLVDETADVGSGLFVGLLVNRLATFFLLGLLVAVAAHYLEERLRKLELYDQIDDLTELYNSAFFLEDTDLEIGRANRYRTTFAVADLTIEREAFAGFPRRRYRRTVRDLAGRVRDAVRKVDRPARVDEGVRDRILVVLPETGRQGAATFAERLEHSARELLRDRGATVESTVASRALAYPDDAEELDQLRSLVTAAESRRRAIRPDEPAAR